MKSFVRATIILALIVAFGAMAQAQSVKPVTVKPGKEVEKCVALTPPQKIEYAFESSANLNFNLHYHKGDQVYYPVKLDRTNRETGLYEAKTRETYCLMWENKTGADVELTYSARIAK